MCLEQGFDIDKIVGVEKDILAAALCCHAMALELLTLSTEPSNIVASFFQDSGHPFEISGILWVVIRIIKALDLAIPCCVCHVLSCGLGFSI